MSKALPIVVATALAAVAAVPIYYAVKNPTEYLPAKQVQFNPQTATPIQKISYYLGYKVTTEMAPPEIDIAAFNAGTADGHARKPVVYTEQELNAAMQSYMTEQQQKQALSQPQANSQAAQQDTPNTAVASAQTGAAFLAQHAKQAGVKTTASGLQYKVIRQGNGKQPTATDKVKVNYEGRLVSGQIFDSSYQRGEPIEFALNQVIPGWTEGLQLMKEGSEYEFVIPANLAYGSQDMGSIPPNSTLIFKVELLKVQ